MKIINKIYDKPIANEELKYLNNNTCLLDIETTGFSREANHIYMIGLARLEKNTVRITLLFADKRTEEKDILNEFIKYSKDIKRFVSFNGITFDFPFIKKRMIHYNIDYDYTQYEHLDIYKECKNLKEMLCLSNLKQKTFEAFLGIDREDEYSGGELISQYKSYEKYKDGSVNILFTGRISPHKKIEDIIKIFAYYHKNINAKSRLILIGGALACYKNAIDAYILQNTIKYSIIYSFTKPLRGRVKKYKAF